MSDSFILLAGYLGAGFFFASAAYVRAQRVQETGMDAEVCIHLFLWALYVLRPIALLIRAWKRFLDRALDRAERRREQRHRRWVENQDSADDDY